MYLAQAQKAAAHQQQKIASKVDDGLMAAAFALSDRQKQAACFQEL